jgi:hypothetical protein
VKPKSVYLSKISEGLFSELPYMLSNDEKVRRISAQSFGGKKISNLQDLIDAIPYLSKKRNFIFKFYNHSLNFNQFGYIGMQNDCLDWKEIELNTDYIEDAKVFKFDSATNDWTSSSIVINQDKNSDS